jgi:hypothetical protein
MFKSGQIILFLVLCDVAVTCSAQSIAQDSYGTIPVWVKLDRALLAEKAGPLDSSISRAGADYPTYEASPFHSAKAGKTPSYDAYRMQERPFGSTFPRDFDTPPNNYRPSVDIPGGWRVAMPNFRKNVARLLVQHSF